MRRIHPDQGALRLRRGALLVSVVLLVLIAMPAGAITWGQPDGDRHPNVGALVVDDPDRGWRRICSGTLIAADVFLTAGHCTEALEHGPFQDRGHAVSFDSVFDPATSPRITGTVHTHPQLSIFSAGGMRDANDLGVVVLDRPAAEVYPGIQPASLPTLRLLDEMNRKNGLRGQRFTAVGYGAQEAQLGGGPPTRVNVPERRFSVSSFRALQNAWLQLSQNPATGDGGTCFGDSGGPNFLGAGGGETNVIAAITSWGDSMCRATNTTYRLDTPSARAFLSQFVAVP